MASDETTHLDILIPPQKGPQDDQYLAGCVHWTGIDEVLSRREGSQSSEGIMVRDRWTVNMRGAGEGSQMMVSQNLGKEALTQHLPCFILSNKSILNRRK